MTERALTRTLLKVAGVFWVISSLAVLPLMISFALMPPTEGLPNHFGSGLLGELVVGFIAGCLLLLYADAIARRLVPADSELTAASLPSLEGFEAIAFGLFSIYFFVTGLSGLAKVGYLFLERSSVSRFLPRQIADMWPDAVGAAVELAAGIALFLGRRRLACILSRVHSKQ